MKPSLPPPHLSPDFLRRALEQTRDVLLLVGADGTVAEALGIGRLGYAEADVVGHPVFELVESAYHDFVQASIGRVASGEEVPPFELRALYADGLPRWFEISSGRHVADDGSVWVVAVARDVEARKYAETSTLASEARYRALIDQSPVGILVVDAELNVVSANDAYVRQVGAPDLAALSDHNIMASPAFNSQAVAALAARVRVGEHITASLSYVSLFGKQVHVKVRASPIVDEAGEYASALLLFEDVSESRRLEEQLRQSQKMEAVGRLAGGVAHDFNNNLTVILGLAEFLEESADLTAEQRGAATEIVRASERSAALTRQLLAFSRRDRAVLEPVDLAPVLGQVESLLQLVLGEGVELVCEIEDGLPPIEADPKLFEQVLVNLATNARDAMPEGGQLRIVGREEGADVVVEVYDNGCGMDERTAGLSLEPFFTTKPAAQGTGLGLAVVYGIVKQFGGELALESTVDVGTCVRMHFPALDRRASESPPQSAVLPRGPVSSGGERILVLEDQEAVRRFLATGLRRYGYEVVEAATGEGALELARDSVPPIDLFLSDVRLPDLSGPETVAALRADLPDLRVLYMSGCTDAPRDAQGRMADGFDLLAKPFSLQHLATRVRDLLDAPATTDPPAVAGR